jgi:FkbM family methyltransferase
MKGKVALPHKIAFNFSRKGFRGSSIIWKIARRFTTERNGELVTLPNGFPMIVDKADWIARTIYEGTYERPLISLLNMIKVDGCFLDIGANIGVTLWHGMKGSESESTYCAFEPSEQCQHGLLLSTQDIRNTGKILKIAIGDTTEMRIMHGLNNPEQSGGGSLLQHNGLNGEAITVQVRTLDELILEDQIPASVYLLKVDTEGYEAQVLDGGKNLLSRQEVRIFILEVSPSFCSTDWVKDLYFQMYSNYTFLMLTEEGFFRMKPKLIEVSLEEAIGLDKQWNLVIIRDDTFLTNPELKRIVY